MSLAAGTRLGAHEIVSPLARAATLKTVWQVFLFDSLRGDPRWAELERRIAIAGPPPP